MSTGRKFFDNWVSYHYRQDFKEVEFERSTERRGDKMTAIYRLLLVFWLVILSSNSFAEQRLTLQDCLALANQNNPRLVQLRAGIEQSKTGITSAYSSFYPSVSLSSSYRNNEDPSGGRSGSYSSGVGLSLPLYQGGNIRAGVKIARIRVQMAEENYRQGEDDVVLSVKEAFFKILLKQEQIALAEDVLKRQKEDLVLIRLKYESGRESSPAVKEAEANLLQSEYNREQAEKELILAQIELNLLVGRPRRAEVSIEYEDKESKFPPLESLIEEAKAVRPDVFAERADLEVLKAQITQAKSDYFPKVSLSSSYGWGGRDFSKQTGNWSAGVSLSLPIFEGFSTQAKVKQATLSLREQEAGLQELEQQIEEEIEQAYSNWELAGKVIEVNEKTLQAAREIYQLTKLQYEQGLTSYFFLQQKESDLANAESRYVNALYDLRVSIARLENSWGRRS
jgi:outer membrane protein